MNSFFFILRLVFANLWCAFSLMLAVVIFYMMLLISWQFEAIKRMEDEAIELGYGDRFVVQTNKGSHWRFYYFDNPSIPAQARRLRDDEEVESPSSP